ncbi:MAG: hypothetical protein KC442_18670 [Thermomicrobiales bacterium]|nr:hypothetical protein [Thermomicrobiales bacterium]
MPLLRRSAIALLLAACLLPWLAGTAAAHVDVDVADGQYVMEVGFRDEPALLGQPNAVFVAVEAYGTGGTTPVDGLAGSLQAEVSRDGATKTIALVPTGDGTYEAPFVPTATGDYTFRIFGEIAGNPVDESVTSGPQTFNSVDPLTSFEFPPVSATASNLEADLAAAQSAATQARTISFVSLIVGGLALIAALLMSMRNRRPIAETEIPRPVDPPGRLIK